MYKDAHRVRHSPNPSSSPIRSSSSSIITRDHFQSNTSTLRKRAPMPDPSDTPHHMIPFTHSGSSSGTAPPVATHDEPLAASAPSSQIPGCPADVQVVGTVETKSSLDVAPARDPPHQTVDSNLRQTTWGIFKVAYVVPSIPFLSFAMLAEYWKGRKVLHRLLKELWIVDWQHCLEYYACTIWLIVSPSFSLCFAYLVLLNLERLINRQGSGLAPELQEVQYLAIMWLFSGMLSDRIELNMLRIRAEFGGHLRPYFTPRLVKARFEIDPAYSPSGFPAAHDYGDFIPGWDFFDDFFIRVRLILTICLEIAVMGYIISREEGRSVNPLGSNVLAILVAAPLVFTFIAPTNGAGSAGYAFWTTNREYNQLKVLFNMVFHSTYLPLLIKDGLADSILEEYNRVTTALGVVRADTWILGWQIPSPWYWDIPLTWTVNYPMALCALVFPFISFTSMITTVALLQYATSTMHNSAKALRNLIARFSILQIMRNIEQFYDVLDSPAAPRGTLDYPNAKSLKGSRFTLKDVSYKYASQMAPAINNVSLDIAPGQLVLIVGENGSGKSTLLKILSGLVNPTEGEVLLDHTALSLYDGNAFRRATAFIAQGEAVYPVSLRDNMLMCLSDDRHRESITQQDLTEAARLGGSLDFIEKLNQRFDTVLEPCSIPAWSFTLFPAQAALDAMNRDYPIPEPVGISPGEKQRLIASKAFMKIKHSETKLIILDEATNSLDSRAERKIFDQFIQISRESGQTLIIVAHRLAHIALQADQILFMKDGKVEEKGTHEELMARSQDGYAKFYNADLASPAV